MNKSKIEWCDMTWNPVTGCLHGCPYCYARRIAERFGGCLDDGNKLHYLFLTKNPKRYCALYAAGNLPIDENFWYGTTVTSENDLRFPGALRLNTFLSVEPLLGYLNVGLGSFGFDRWVIIGAETGNRKGKVTPEKAWVDNITDTASITHAAVFMKESLLPIVGEDGMRRELPWETNG